MEVCPELHAPPKVELKRNPKFSIRGNVGLLHNVRSWHRTGSQGEGSTLSRLRLCARLERGWDLRGTAGAKKRSID